MTTPQPAAPDNGVRGSNAVRDLVDTDRELALLRELIQAAAASRSREELAALVAAGRKTPGYYTVATADQVLEDLSLDTVAASGQLVPYSPRPPWPVWNLFLFSFVPVMMLLTGGWLLRKAVNLL